MIKRIPEKVCVFATTNMPWEMDVGVLKRFERKILVPMPDKETRQYIIKLHSGDHHNLTDKDFEQLSRITDGYSGSDLGTMVNDALMRPVKELQNAKFFKKVFMNESDIKDLEECSDNTQDFYWAPMDIKEKKVLKE